jgi:hypothetical protein
LKILFSVLEDEFEGFPADTQAVLGNQLELRCEPPQGKNYFKIKTFHL